MIAWVPRGDALAEIAVARESIELRECVNGRFECLDRGQNGPLQHPSGVCLWWSGFSGRDRGRFFAAENLRIGLQPAATPGHRWVRRVARDASGRRAAG